MKVKSSSRLKISRSNMSLKGEERRNLWLEKYRDNSEKFKTWKASRNYSYFFSHGKSFGICRVVITGLPGSGKATLLFTLKTLLEETKGKSETFLRFVPFFFLSSFFSVPCALLPLVCLLFPERQRTGSISQALSKLSLKRKTSEVPTLTDVPSTLNGIVRHILFFEPCARVSLFSSSFLLFH